MIVLDVIGLKYRDNHSDILDGTYYGVSVEFDILNQYDSDAIGVFIMNQTGKHLIGFIPKSCRPWSVLGLTTALMYAKKHVIISSYQYNRKVNLYIDSCYSDIVKGGVVWFSQI